MIVKIQDRPRSQDLTRVSGRQENLDHLTFVLGKSEEGSIWLLRNHRESVDVLYMDVLVALILEHRYQNIKIV